MLKSINPYTGETLEKFKEHSKSDVSKKIKKADKTFKDWKHTTFARKSELMHNLAEELINNKKDYATAITKEMGKPIAQAIAEIEKCAWVCNYYAEHAENQLKKEIIETDAQESYVRFDPLGVILAVMPWNYPFWQVFRFIAPALMAGNVGVLKHASNVMRCAENIEKAIQNAGFPDGCFQNLIISSKKVENIIRDKRIKAVTLTGSKPAGSAVASIAGEEIKKSLLELGGSNALVVFEDANIEESVKTCVQARFQNTGQSCIAGKRLLVHESIYNEVVEALITETRELKSGDPLEEDTFIGVMAREDLAKDLEDQLNRAIQGGAKVVLGGKRNKTYFEPTIVINVSKKSPIFLEETFGPLISVTSFKTDMEAIDLVNKSDFGLGVSVFTEDFERAKALISQFDDGAVFINSMVKSDPRLPFGGTKDSGYGRELSSDGIKEFLNRKTVYINKF
ncbi:succinate-semialdehyde dehydrogenase / glutarate-semialdehyde dehydrogenase [Mesonia phycicola]|uniref:Succinate-semialdehyde dehydrogenase / glutarate-semialdehyde dehydrogenase n=1 Tax=Mesonia phycicola TaxID=579105 RepID=A0A1M6DM18_9FLAO|nr:NAD-dependent succinate-semialdehyde dehydrogenase [Mesonia phycicola]SHI74252.1 succinate-semialdehyde dehydrogenase / glutarate-semialdehyde dehydrogenase [Mesonia phycicola]